MAKKKAPKKSVAKVKKSKLLSSQDFLDKLDWEGGAVDALAYYGLDPMEYDLPNAKEIKECSDNLKPLIRELESLIQEVEDALPELDEDPEADSESA